MSTDFFQGGSVVMIFINFESFTLTRKSKRWIATLATKITKIGKLKMNWPPVDLALALTDRCTQ